MRPSPIEEWPFPGGDPTAFAEALARAKVAAVDGPLVLGADTIVVVDGQVVGKPAGPDEAAAMLRRLSGRAHRVVTGVAVRDRGDVRSGHATSTVTFRGLGEREIAAYVAGGEPLDKAGAYAFQGAAAGFVTAMDGDADTVIGLPMRLVTTLLVLQPHFRSGRACR